MAEENVILTNIGKQNFLTFDPNLLEISSNFT